MASVPELLEAKRLELGETKAAFARRLFPDSKPETAEVAYGHMSNGGRPFPAKHLPAAAELLGMPIEKLSKIPLKKGGVMDTDPAFDSETLRYLADVADVLGFPMSFELVARILSEREADRIINGGPT